MIENVAPETAMDALRTDEQARLVDVRTDVEWMFVGVPDVGETGRDAVLIPWQMYPGMQVNGGFVENLRQAGVTPAHKVYFLCRSGARSMAAAQAAQAAGFGSVFNVADGFEGPPDAEGHRGQVAGWKAAGLPWRQR